MMRYKYDDANQLVLSKGPDGTVTRYAYDAAGRMIADGAKRYTYGYLDKVMSLVDGDSKYSYTYHVDGQIASATVNGETEDYLWDGLALVKRGKRGYINEPHIGGGNPVLASNGTTFFNDALGTTLAASRGDKTEQVALTTFGDTIAGGVQTLDGDSSRSPFPIPRSPSFFTGKPDIPGLGRAFLMRNYRADLGKWQTADPMGYPDGWNQLAYCGNIILDSVDVLGGKMVDLFYTGRWKCEDSLSDTGYPLTDVYKYMKDTWENGTKTMAILKIKTFKNFLAKIREALTDEAKKELKKIFDDGFWFDELMKAVPECGYYCDPPSKETIDQLAAEKIGDRQYEVVKMVVDSLDPVVEDSISGAWFIYGCDQRWRITIKYE